MSTTNYSKTKTNKYVTMKTCYVISLHQSLIEIKSSSISYMIEKIHQDRL